MPALYNQSRYDAARSANIKANRAVSGARKLASAIANDSPEFRAWLRCGDIPGLAAIRERAQAEFDASDDGEISDATNRALNEANSSFWRLYGATPSFLVDAMREWGGLTDGQLAWARKEFAARAEKVATRKAEADARKATTPSWVAGRQIVIGTVVARSLRKTDFGTSWKLIIETADGRRLWVTEPSSIETERGTKVSLTATVAPKEEDPTFAFGSRPTKATVMA